jgi:hypothetical protein
MRWLTTTGGSKDTVAADGKTKEDGANRSGGKADLTDDASKVAGRKSGGSKDSGSKEIGSRDSYVIMVNLDSTDALQLRWESTDLNLDAIYPLGICGYLLFSDPVC